MRKLLNVKQSEQGDILTYYSECSDYDSKWVHLGSGIYFLYTFH